MSTHILRTIALLAVVSLGAGLGSRPDAMAVDETPAMTVWGQVFMNGVLAPAGTEVEVVFGDTICATTSVTEGLSLITDAPTTVYSVDLPARASGGCGGPRQSLSLRVNGQDGASVNWEAGAHLTKNVVVGSDALDPMHTFFDLLSAAIVDGERLAGEGNVTIRADGVDCATVKAVSIGQGVTAIENVLLWVKSVAMPDACAVLNAPLEFFLDGQKLEVLLGWATLRPFAESDHFLLLGVNPGGMLIDGRLFLDEEPAPAGTKIEAVVDDIVCGETVLRSVDPTLYPYTGSGTFVMPVGGALGVEADCAEGAEMRFRVGDDWANETVEIANSGVVRTRLTVGESDFVPIGGEVIGDSSGLPLSGTLSVTEDGVECGRATMALNDFGKHLYTDLIARCDTQDVREMQFFLDRRPLSVTYAGEPIPDVISPAGIQYVTLKDVSGAMFTHGTLFVDGRAAQAGTRLDALVGDTVCGQTSVRPYGQENDLFPEEGRYWLPVNSDLRREGCGVEGSDVTFRVDGREANETVSWQPEGGQEDLRVTVGMKDLAVYHGTIVSYRSLPSEGTVRAFVGDKECGSAAYSHNMYGTPNYSNLVVPSEEDVPGCGRPGAVVEFKLDGQLEGERLESFDGPITWAASTTDEDVTLQLEPPGGYGVVVDYFPDGAQPPNTGEGTAIGGLDPADVIVAAALLSALALLASAAALRVGHGRKRS